MKVQFKNGTVKNCTAPIEQKIFKNGDAAGWILLLNLTESFTSGELDAIITDDSITEMTFLTDDESSTQLFQLTGYSKITSVIIKHSEEKDKSKVEIQSTKGV